MKRSNRSSRRVDAAKRNPQLLRYACPVTPWKRGTSLMLIPETTPTQVTPAEVGERGQ